MGKQQTAPGAVAPKSISKPPPFPVKVTNRPFDEQVYLDLLLLRAAGLGRPRNGPVSTKQQTKPDGASWYKLQNLGGNAADLWIYDEIGMWGVTAQDMVAELSGLNVAEITVHLNSPGGDVFDGIAIMNALRDHPANVTVKVDALAASIASVIAQAGNKVIMGRNSTMMIHNASGFAMGEAKDLIKMAELLQATTENIASIYAERAGGTKAEWMAVMDVETWYTADEAVKAGLADEVAPLPTERDAHKQAANFDLSVYNHAPKIEDIPGWEGTVGPGPGQYAEPHVYARDTHSGSGNCVCGGAPMDDLHVPSPLAPNPQPLPEAEPIAWDPSAFKAALAEAVPEPVSWDPSLFKSAVSMVTNDMPAAELPAPEPAPQSSVFDPSEFAAAIRKART